MSDPARRAEYDSLFRSRPSSAFTDEKATEEEQDQASGSFFENFAQYFKSAAGGAAGAGSSTGTTGAGAGSSGMGAGAGLRPDADGVFGDVFEEMLAPEVQRVRPWWSWIGGASGAAIGYIVANVPGAVAGGVAGNRLGAVRDAKGRSVAQVFSSMESSKKAEVG